METNYRIAYQKGWDDLKSKNPLFLQSRLSVSYSAETGKWTVPFFNEDYVVDPVTQTIQNKKDGKAPDITASIIILHYLTYSDFTPSLKGEWVSLKEIPGGGALFYPAFQKNSIEPLIQTFGRQPKLFSQCAAKLGGHLTLTGSASAVFYPFPEIPISIVIWEGDEEIKPSAAVLFDPSTAYLLHIETLIGLGMYLVSRLIRIANLLK